MKLAPDAPDRPPLASLEAVAKRFDEVQALHSLDLAVRPGEVLGLLGPNGAGKTTALRILCGLLVPDSGRAVIDGVDVQTEPLEARRRYAYVPDGAPLYDNLSARQHLTLVGSLHDLPREESDARARRLLAALELESRADDPVGAFSRGMRQKTAIACALLPRPALLVLDEPLSGLDAPTTAVIKALLRGWAERGRSVLYTSHLLDVVERVCDRMAILASGRLVAEGSLNELRERAGREGSLEEVFRAVAQTEDPAAAARRILDEAG